VLRLLGELERIAEKWTDALDRRTETVKRASKNSALLSVESIRSKKPVSSVKGYLRPPGMGLIVGAFRRENILARGNSIVPFSQPCVAPELVHNG
jgi:hypothetical protein